MNKAYSLKMLTNVGVIVPKSEKQGEYTLYMLCSKGGDYGMSNNTMCDYIIEKYREGVTHDNIVACHNLLSCCIYTAIVSPIFGTALHPAIFCFAVFIT